MRDWELAESHARRRHAYFDGHGTLAALIASVSDIDDMIPMITAYQIEWNKLHQRLRNSQVIIRVDEVLCRKRMPSADLVAEICTELGLDPDDMSRLQGLWKGALWENLRLISDEPKNISVRLLAGSLSDYRKATQSWWRNITETAGELLKERPVYFVSSNTHVMPNLFSGYSRQAREELLSFVEETRLERLDEEAEEALAAESRGQPGRLENLLYYVLRARRRDPVVREAMEAWDRESAFINVESAHGLDVDAQVFELASLHPDRFDSRLFMPGLEKLRKSRAVILNIDYPLGMAAYHLLSQVASGVDHLEAVYVMGKAATLNGRVGDVMIPNVVFDQHSQNTYLFRNALRGSDVSPWLSLGTVLDNQKAVTVRGTFLQNSSFMHVFYQEGYTDIEMETGPYLSAVYEDAAPKRYPMDQIVNLFLLAPYELGFLHYASDTPISRRQELLSRSLSFFGMDSTYACAVAILRRILQREIERL